MVGNCLHRFRKLDGIYVIDLCDKNISKRNSDKLHILSEINTKKEATPRLDKDP